MALSLPVPRVRRAVRTPGPYTIVTGILAAGVVFVVLYPLLRLAFEVFAPGGRPTIEPFQRAFALPDIGTTIANTALIVLLSTGLSVVIAAGFAWLNERTDARLGVVADLLPLMPLVVPALMGAVGWVFLLSPRAGVLNVLLRDLTGGGESGPLNISSLWGLVFMYTLILTPYVYLPVSAALSQLDSSLEEAARINGDGPFRAMVRVTLPAIKPALTAGAFTAFVIGLATFSIPMIIGPAAHIDVLSVRIYRLMTQGYPPDTNAATALGALLMFFVLIAWLLQRRVVRGGAYAKIGGKGAQHGTVSLGWWRWPARLVMVVFLLVGSVVPFLALLYISLRGFWTADLTLRGMTLSNYQDVFSNPSTWSGIKVSVTLAAIGSVLGMVLAAILAVYVQSRTGLLSRVVDGVTKLPSAINHIVIAVAFVTVFSLPPFRMYGSISLLLLAYLVLFLPQANLTAGAAYTQISSEMMEASAVSGAARGRTFGRITLPLMMPGLAGGVAILFVSIAGEITASSLLATSGRPVIGFVVLDLWTSGTFPLIAALGTLMTVISATAVAVALYLGKFRAAARARA